MNPQVFSGLPSRHNQASRLETEVNQGYSAWTKLVPPQCLLVFSSKLRHTIIRRRMSCPPFHIYLFSLAGFLFPELLWLEVSCITHCWMSLYENLHLLKKEFLFVYPEQSFMTDVQYWFQANRATLRGTFSQRYVQIFCFTQGSSEIAHIYVEMSYLSCIYLYLQYKSI